MFFKPESTAPTCPTCVAENPKTPEEQPPQETPDQTEQNKDLTIGRSFDNVVNNKQETYYNTYSEIEAKHITVLDKNGDQNYDFSYINCNSDICKIFNEKGEETATIDNFQGKIKDFYYIVFGQAYGSGKLYFVMRDGSVEYIPVDEAFNTNNIKSYGKIVGLSDIVKIHQVSLTSLDNNNTLLGNGAGALAEDKEGKFYDLTNPLE